MDFAMCGHQVSTENFSKFKVLIKPQRDMTFEDLRGGSQWLICVAYCSISEYNAVCDYSMYSDDILTISDDKSYTSDVTNMCLLLSRMQILKDIRQASNADNQKDAESHYTSGDEDSKKQEEESMTYDDKEDDFSYAGVYDETF